MDTQSNQLQTTEASSATFRNRETVILWLIVPVLILFCAGCCWLFSFLWQKFGCYDYGDNKLLSPVGQYQDVIFRSDCGGAPAPDAHEVSILRTGQKLYHFQRGNVFIGSYGCDYLKVKWISNGQLKVWYGIARNVAGRTILPALMRKERDGTSIDYQLEPNCPPQ